MQKGIPGLVLFLPLLSWLLIISSVVTLVKAYKHVIFMHGILANGPVEFEPFAKFINKTHPGTTYSVIDAYNKLESLFPMWHQIEYIRPKIAEIMKQHPEGVHLLCFSQGGMICRGVLETLDNHNVINFISYASPQGGQFGDTMFLKFLFPKLLKENAYKFFYTREGQDVSVGNYWNDPHHQKEYRENSKFLAVINNQTQNPHSLEYKKNFARLKNLVLIGGPDDGVIAPWQSSFFGAYNDKEEVVEMRDQEWYKQDWFGLKTLDQRNAIHECVFPGIEHIHWRRNFTVFEKCILPYLT